MDTNSEGRPDSPGLPSPGFFGRIGNAWQRSVRDGGGFIPTVLIGWSLELAYGLSRGDWAEGLRIFCILWFASGAAFFVGTIGGFLFGIPKARSQPVGAVSDEPGTSSAANYRDNTNLEEVSDWLTKIIIGIGLVEIERISNKIAAVGAMVGDAVDRDHRYGGAAIATGSIIVGFSTGFLYYYLWARVYLLRRLSRSAQEYNS